MGFVVAIKQLLASSDKDTSTQAVSQLSSLRSEGRHSPQDRRGHLPHAHQHRISDDVDAAQQVVAPEICARSLYVSNQAWLFKNVKSKSTWVLLQPHLLWKSDPVDYIRINSFAMPVSATTTICVIIVSSMERMPVLELMYELFKSMVDFLEEVIKTPRLLLDIYTISITSGSADEALQPITTVLGQLDKQVRDGRPVPREPQAAHQRGAVQHRGAAHHRERTVLVIWNAVCGDRVIGEHQTDAAAGRFCLHERLHTKGRMLFTITAKLVLRPMSASSPERQNMVVRDISQFANCHWTSLCIKVSLQIYQQLKNHMVVPTTIGALVTNIAFPGVYTISAIQETCKPATCRGR
ncbi:hypothetical protein C8J57DRAFT_1536491 [Mycena rebaudengoi]|nr:hypothetical protein C8J57DRAFT_1536491 [Mycena rebaudengoi]